MRWDLNADMRVHLCTPYDATHHSFQAFDKWLHLKQAKAMAETLKSRSFVVHKRDEGSKVNCSALKSKSLFGGGGGRKVTFGCGGDESGDGDGDSDEPNPGFLAMLAIAKFKRGGKRSHDEWVRQKEAGDVL
jgi:hypothetical protein